MSHNLLILKPWNLYFLWTKRGKNNQWACYNMIWSWSHMSRENMASITTETSWSNPLLDLIVIRGCSNYLFMAQAHYTDESNTFLVHWGRVTQISPRWIVSSLDQILACRLFGAKPLPEPMLKYCQLNHQERISMTFYLKFQSFHSMTCIENTVWKMSAILSGPLYVSIGGPRYAVYNE